MYNKVPGIGILVYRLPHCQKAHILFISDPQLHFKVTKNLSTCAGKAAAAAALL